MHAAKQWQAEKKEFIQQIRSYQEIVRLKFFKHEDACKFQVYGYSEFKKYNIKVQEIDCTWWKKKKKTTHSAKKEEKEEEGKTII